MHYEMKREYYLQEFDIPLEPGDRFANGDLEPDVVAQLWSLDIIQKVRQPIEIDPEPLPFEDEIEPLDAEEPED
jgi:hypothetical protein